MRKAVASKVVVFIDGWLYTNKYLLGRLCCLNIHKSHNYQISNRNIQLSVCNLSLLFSFLFSLLTFLILLDKKAFINHKTRQTVIFVLLVFSKLSEVFPLKTSRKGKKSDDDDEGSRHFRNAITRFWAEAAYTLGTN